MIIGKSEFLGTSPSDCSTTCAAWVLPNFLLVHGTAGWYSTPFTVTFHRNLRLFVGPLSTQANDGTDQCRFWHSSINPEMGFLPATKYRTLTDLKKHLQSPFAQTLWESNFSSNLAFLLEKFQTFWPFRNHSLKFSISTYARVQSSVGARNFSIFKW